MTHSYANCGVIFSTKFQRIVTFHFMGAGEGGSEKNGHHFPFSSDVEFYLLSLIRLESVSLNIRNHFYAINTR